MAGYRRVGDVGYRQFVAWKRNCESQATAPALSCTEELKEIVVYRNSARHASTYAPPNRTVIAGRPAPSSAVD